MSGTYEWGQMLHQQNLVHTHKLWNTSGNIIWGQKLNLMYAHDGYIV